MVAISDIKTQAQFDGYYRENRLSTVDEKINHLMEATGVMAMRGGSEKPDVMLAVLEESTLLGYWKDL